MAEVASPGLLRLIFFKLCYSPYTYQVHIFRAIVSVCVCVRRLARARVVCVCVCERVRSLVCGCVRALSLACVCLSVCVF